MNGELEPRVKAALLIFGGEEPQMSNRGLTRLDTLPTWVIVLGIVEHAWDAKVVIRPIARKDWRLSTPFLGWEEGYLGFDIGWSWRGEHGA